jgi:hypothetical protein
LKQNPRFNNNDSNNQDNFERDYEEGASNPDKELKSAKEEEEQVENFFARTRNEFAPVSLVNSVLQYSR